MSKTTFYAYLQDGTLRRNKLQLDYPKYELVQGRTKQEDRYVSKYEPIVFEKGVYETDEPEIIEYLRIYNTGGELKEKDGLGRPIQVKPDYILAIIKEDAPVDTKTVVKTETVTKEVHKIPREFALALDVQALQAYCVSYKIDMPKDKTKDSLMKVMELAGFIAD